MRASIGSITSIQVDPAESQVAPPCRLHHFAPNEWCTDCQRYRDSLRAHASRLVCSMASSDKSTAPFLLSRVARPRHSSSDSLASFATISTVPRPGLLSGGSSVISSSPSDAATSDGERPISKKPITAVDLTAQFYSRPNRPVTPPPPILQPQPRRIIRMDFMQIESAAYAHVNLSMVRPGPIAPPSGPVTHNGISRRTSGYNAQLTSYTTELVDDDNDEKSLPLWRQYRELPHMRDLIDDVHDEIVFPGAKGMPHTWGLVNAAAGKVFISAVTARPRPRWPIAATATMDTVATLGPVPTIPPAAVHPHTYHPSSLLGRIYGDVRFSLDVNHMETGDGEDVADFEEVDIGASASIVPLPKWWYNGIW